MSNSGAHEMAQAQARMAGRFTGLPETGVVAPQPGAHAAPDGREPHHAGRDLEHQARDLDPAGHDLSPAAPIGRDLLPPPPAAGRDLDPAVAGLIARLPVAGGTMTPAAIGRWTDAARAVLTLAYAVDDDPHF
ncbi:hypothetical protein [Actinomadura harenae]|nr:hypothetical protein [Actinomadura harenae]